MSRETKLNFPDVAAEVSIHFEGITNCVFSKLFDELKFKQIICYSGIMINKLLISLICSNLQCFDKCTCILRVGKF